MAAADLVGFELDVRVAVEEVFECGGLQQTAHALGTAAEVAELELDVTELKDAPDGHVCIEKDPVFSNAHKQPTPVSCQGQLISNMSEVVIQSVETGLTALFQHIYETNCELDGEEVTPEDRLTLTELSPLETLENLKDLTESLLGAKRQLKRTDKAELAERCDQFERLLQKLEGEVRTHIRVEQQLKLHAEATQARLEELQLQRNSAEHPKENLSHNRILSVGGEACSTGLAERKHQTLLQLEKECSDLKSIFAQKRAEYERTKGDYERLLREMQLNRLRPGKENFPKNSSTEKPTKALERPFTDRSKSLKSESPYQPVLRAASKSRLEASEALRFKAHQRSDSERCKSLTKVGSKPTK